MKIISILFAGILMLNQVESVNANQGSTSTETSSFKFNAEIQGESLEFTFWRHALAPDKYTLFMSVAPKNKGEVVICKTSFFILQKGKKFDSLNLHTTKDSNLCYIFLTRTIFELEQTPSKGSFDIKEAFTLVYSSGYYTYQFEIPALHKKTPTPNPQIISTLEPFSYNNDSSTMYQAINHWADLEYQGTDDTGDHLWQLTDQGNSY